MTIPYGEIEGDQCCFVCGEAIVDDCHYDELGNDEYICIPCFEAGEEGRRKDAKEFAAANLRITSPLPRFDEAKAWTITPDQYSSGDKVSNTENAYRTRCRHKHTNYDELIKSLDKHRSLDNAYCDEIRNAANELIDEEIQAKNLICNSDYELDEPRNDNSPLRG